MNPARAAARKVAEVLLPWAPRREREAEIAAARAEKERSLATAARAAVLAREIRRHHEENNFAAAFARAFRGEEGPP